MSSAVAFDSTTAVQGQAEAIRAGYQWLLAVPPLLLGTGAALMMKRAFDEPKEPVRG